MEKCQCRRVLRGEPSALSCFCSFRHYLSTALLFEAWKNYFASSPTASLLSHHSLARLHYLLPRYATNMAAEIAREIIAQSRGGSKLAFSFNEGEALLYTSTSKSADDKRIYHVHKGRSNPTEQCYEFKYYGDLASTAELIRRMLSRQHSIEVKLVLYKRL